MYLSLKPEDLASGRNKHGLKKDRGFIMSLFTLATLTW